MSFFFPKWPIRSFSLVNLVKNKNLAQVLTDLFKELMKNQLRLNLNFVQGTTTIPLMDVVRNVVHGILLKFCDNLEA